MRVLVVTIVHVPRDARIFARQIEAMRAARFEVTYAAPWSACGQVPPEDLQTIDVPRAAGRDRVTALRSARRVLKDESDSHDLVLVHDPELLLAVAGSGLSTPVVWDVHEDAAASLVARRWVPSALRPLARLAIKAAERWAEGRLHLILAEEAYRERFRGEHPVVPNVPVIPEDVAAPGDRRVVYLGRVARARGAEELVALGRALRGEVTVEIIGDAEADVIGFLERADGRGDVRWVGYLPNDEALDRVAGALAGLSLLHDLPNFRGSMPTKVLEYLACGIPVITTPLPLAEAVVREADAGEVVPFGDVAAAAAAVRGLAKDPARRRDAGTRGREYVRSHRSWEVEAPRFLALLQGWAGRRMELPPLSDSPTVSVVIPARDCAGTLEQAVTSATRELVDEIVIAVGPSIDETRNVAFTLASSHDRVRVVDNPGGTTPAALNRAINTASGEVIVRLDAHSQLPPGYVARALDRLRRTGAANVGGRQRPVASRGFGKAVASAMRSWAGAGGAAYRTGEDEGPVDTVYLGVFRRSALERVGGFDERMVRNQDYELNVRLRERGGTVWYDPALAVDYQPRATVRALARQYFEYGRWRRMTLRLHPRSLRARQLAAPALVAGTAVATLVSLVGRRWWPIGLPALAYVTALGIAGAQATGNARETPTTMVALATMHLSWGLGFLVGPPRGALSPDRRLDHP